MLVLFSFLTIDVNAQKTTTSGVVKNNDLSTANIYHIVMYGQSLMLGTSSVPLITEKQQYNSLMFNGGVRSGYDKPLETFHSGFSPLVEKVSKSLTGAQLGETPASGFSETFLHLLIKENRYSFDTVRKSFKNKDFALLISCPAQGSTSADLLCNGEYWGRLKKDIIEGQRLASQAGKIYNVPCILWNQGEKDIDLQTPPQVYKDLLIAFQKKADEFIKSITRQTNPVKLILYQTVSHNVRKSKSYIQIANAQYELARDELNITMSNTTYQLPYYKDNVHLTNVASKWNGANHAIAAKRISIDHKNWRSIYVKKVSYKGNDLFLEFHVPVPPLVLDKNLISNPGNYGFSVLNANEEEIRVKNVSLTNSYTVKITLDENVVAGQSIWYGKNGTTTGAQNGARGNLRDSQGSKIAISINGEKIELHNWTPLFMESIK